MNKLRKHINIISKEMYQGIRNVPPNGVFGNEVYGSDSEGFGMNPSSNEFRLCNSDEWRSGNHGGRVIIRGYGGGGDMVRIRNVPPNEVFGNEAYGSDSEGFGMNPSSNEFRLCNSDEWRSGNHGGRVIIRGYGGGGDMVVRHGLKRPIRRIQDFDESNDHCLTLKNKSYPHQRYPIYNTLVNEEEPTGFTSIRLTMTKVIKGEFEKLEFVKISDVSLTCNTSLEIFNEEFNWMSRMDDDLFTYEVEIFDVTNIACDLKKEDDSEQQISHESDDDMKYDPYDARGDDEVELTNEESFDSEEEEEVAKNFRIETNVFDFETPLCRAFMEFNYLLQIDADVLTKDIDRFKTYKEYKDD
ncbi:hypothetical protein Tco_1245456 [Tanacetum coccineum]